MTTLGSRRGVVPRRAGGGHPQLAGGPQSAVGARHSGDADLDVPFEENGAVLERTHRSYGGTVKTILKPSGGHHPHSLPDVTPIVQFVLSSASNQIQ